MRFPRGDATDMEICLMKNAVVSLLFCLMLMPGILAGCVHNTQQALRIDLDNAQQRREVLRKYRPDSSVRQILFISHTSGWNAKAWLYEKQGINNAWSMTLETEAFIGKNGMGKTREGDGKTPCGDYAVTGAFGILPNPGTALPYTNVSPATYACDEDCEYYNTIVDTEATGHVCKGENMFAFTPEYNHGLVTSYNENNTRNAGSAIFIHGKGMKPFTGGCIALAEADVKTLLRAAHRGMRIYLDEYYH